MKKFLSLMLAMIMVMSLVTVGAGAAFTDADDIAYVEAVDLMTGLGILQGSGDGTFSPKGNLSRAAAAKIIAYIALGAKAADAMTYDKVVFPDVPTTSSTAPYIAWCAEQGIINGYTDGTFGRTNTVSGHAFLKMVLGALGIYGQYTGTGWQTIVTAAAKEAKLLEGLDEAIVLSQPLTREAACQIAFNAMQVNRGNGLAVKGYLVEGTLFNTLVEAATYINLMKLDVAPKYVYVEGGKMLEKVHGVEEAVTGTIIKNSANADTKLTTVKVKGEDVLFATETGLAQLGNTVKVYYKENTTDYATKGHTVVSVYDACTEIKVTATTTAAQLKTALAAVGITKDVDAKGVAALSAAGTVGTEDVAITVGTTTGEKLGAKTLIVNNKAVVGVKYDLAKSLEKIGTVTTTADKATIEIVGVKDPIDDGVKNTTTGVVSDKINAYEGIAKDDIVVLTKIGDIYNVEKAATVTGKLTKINGTKVTLGGVEYDQLGTDKVVNKSLTLDFATEYVLYLDGQGNYIAIDTVKAAENKTTVFFVTGYTKDTKTVDAFTGKETVKETYWAQCVDTTGAEVNFQLKEQKDTPAAKGVYEVTLTTEKKVEYASFKNVGYDTAEDITSKDIKVKDTTYYFADDVKFIAVEKSLKDLKATVKAGVQDVTNAVSIFATEEKVDGKGTGNYVVSVVFVDGAFATVNEKSEDIVYALETKPSTVQVPYVSGTTTKTGFEHTVYIDGVKTTIVTDKADALAGFITLTKVVDGVYSTEANGAQNLYNGVTVTNVYGTKITFAGREDIDAADADIVDVVHTKAAEKISTIDKLKGAKVAVVVDTTSTIAVVATIYVIG